LTLKTQYPKSISTNGIFLNIHYYPSQYFFDLGEIKFENLNISENNIISAKLAKVISRYAPDVK
jgi:phosphorylcholine metabolism protein LicD